MGDHRGEMGEQRGEMTMPLGPQTKNKLAKSSEGLKELLPGIPDSIALTHIAPKLPWRAVRILSLVSAAWQRAVHSREVYEARIRAGSTETFYVICHTLPEVVPRGENYSEHVHEISVYSVEDKRCYQLPAITSLKKGIPAYCQCISLNGKVYILGGEVESSGGYSSFCKEVYELDVAGKWKWKRCADMQHGRADFACGVMDEQIYVFGGRQSVNESEAYDPKGDTWSSIIPMMIPRCRHHVTALGEELVLHGGTFSLSLVMNWSNLEVYHPGRNERRLVVPHSQSDIVTDVPDGLFPANGKLHSITKNRIYVLDMGTDDYTVTNLRGLSLYEEWPLLTDETVYHVQPRIARFVNGELLALASCYNCEVNRYKTFLLQTKGFGSENRDLLWENAACSLSFEHLVTPFICPIQL